ncbi:MAG: hypothetical protein K2O18_17930 [Oscillospiraceae bacterium]|nr:hypothetical protein [Oscillospiraceae bacterium]
MIKAFLQQAANGQSVYITDVRTAFQTHGTRPFHLHVTLYDRSVRAFALRLPETAGLAEKEFVESYVYANIYNLLSALGGIRIDIYLDKADRDALSLAGGLHQIFQLDLPKTARRGYGKCLNVNERILTALTGGAEQFAFGIHDVRDEPPAEPPKAVTGQCIFSKLPAMTRSRMLLGMDIGGTDVKLAVSIDGQLALCKEFDWFPAACPLAEQITGPLLLLARLLRAAGSLYWAGQAAEIDWNALDRHATLEEMERSAAVMEQAAGDGLQNFDAIGLCFPDVVIQNRIVGGEASKTLGLRNNSALDYETQFAEITALNQKLAAYVAEGGAVMNINDGPMASFTAAVEQAAGGGDMSRGFFAHTLGTELGTGWVRPDGSIPEIPLEVYNLIIDLGSYAQREFDSGDVRSVNNVNTALPGTLQRYTSQFGVFRLAAEYLPERAPELMQEVLDRGLFRWEGERLIVPSEPEDMRKPCLEFFMRQAAAGQPVCGEIFRTVGEYLAVTWRETEYILRPETEERTLFGRFVKLPACFQLMCEGAQRREPTLRQYAAGSGLANTALMKQLDAHPNYTVAQFAQAVGAVYYGCMGLTG